ncbi:tRNA-dependent cyclodipeptide synthase, partial [Streptomyces sp. NPDC059956]
VPSSVAAYHVKMPMTDVLFARGGGLRATRNQAYAVVRPEAAEKAQSDPNHPITHAHTAPNEGTVDERRAA